MWNGRLLEVGENALGLILTRSMAEMSRFAVAKGANPITFLGLAGMGDLSCNMHFKSFKKLINLDLI